MSKGKDKYLLVVSFLEGRNFPRRNKTKFIIEAKFDGEHLSTDPVEHLETIEINQELAWELDKKSLQLHKLQRSCIKAICYAVSAEGKESIGYFIIDIRSAPEGIGKPKWFPLLQPKYPKSKPTIQINIYIEDDHQTNELDAHLKHVDKIQEEEENKNQDQIDSSLVNSMRTQLNLNPSQKSNETHVALSKSSLEVKLVESEGYFLIGKQTSTSQTFILTITIAFARNLLRLITNPHAKHDSSSRFHFYYTFLSNQVVTKPFSDIISSQINGERSSIRLHSTYENLKYFFNQLDNLELTFCSDDQPLAKGHFDWMNFLNDWISNNVSDQFMVDYLIKIEPISDGHSPNTSVLSANREETNQSVVGIQIGLQKEIDEMIGHNQTVEINNTFDKQQTTQPNKNGQIVFQNETATIKVDKRQQESMISIKTGLISDAQSQQPSRAHASSNQISYINEEMHLKTAYELQVWKEAREKEFEQQLKKLEAKKLQSLAEAFKQHDIEREILVQKKLKEYNDLELLLKNSLSEVEKREKQLALSESQISRVKADLNRDYENKLIELREASKRVQEKTDHQINLHKFKCENLEEEIAKYKKQIIEWEKKYADKEIEFSRYKERENTRPEVKLQSELNLLNLELVEMTKKFDMMEKAKNHYKEQWTRALKEIAMQKKREEMNAKQTLKKQQQELEHLRLRYLAAEENELIKTDKRNLEAFRSELEKLKSNSRNGSSTKLNSYSDDVLTNCNYQISSSSSCSLDSVKMDSSLKEHISRLRDERDTLLRTGVYTNTDPIIVELDKRIKDCLKEAKLQQHN